MLSQKGVSSIIVISLFLVTCLVAVTSFQGWIKNFSDNIYAEIETDGSDKIFKTGIDTLVGKTLFFKNGYDNLTITTIKISNSICNDTWEIDRGMQEINLSNCNISNTKTNTEIVVISNKGVFTKNIYIETRNLLQSNITLPEGETIIDCMFPSLFTSDTCSNIYLNTSFAGSNNWTVDNITFSDGTASLKNNVITHNQYSSIKTDIKTDMPGTLYFNWKVSSEGFDCLGFCINKDF